MAGKLPRQRPPVHGLFALRLIAAWMKANPPGQSAADQIATLFSLAVDAPAIAAEQSPAAIALATAAILRAQGPVLKIRPATPEEAFARASALLAHLATRRSEAQRGRLVQEMSDALSALVFPDGSLRQGSIDDLCRLDRRLWTLTDGLTRAGDGVPAGLSSLGARMAGYLALITRADGRLPSPMPPSLQPLPERCRCRAVHLPPMPDTPASPADRRCCMWRCGRASARCRSAWR